VASRMHKKQLVLEDDTENESDLASTLAESTSEGKLISMNLYKKSC